MPDPTGGAGSADAAAPQEPPVPARDAATVMLLRDTPSGIEVFLQRRVTAMKFAAGMTVFPGGGVDERDADASIAWAGPSAARWAQWFGCDERLARALVCAAVRETFEESGVLLAGHGPDNIVGDTAGYAGARAALVGREFSLAEFLADAGLTLRGDLLRPWANWVTPEGEKRRYDTRFFAAALPAGQDADGETTEASESGWRTPADAMADGEAGRSMLMPPTWAMLSDLAVCRDVTEVLATHRAPVPKVMPTLRFDGESVLVEL
ncbi:NUDIX hydrolase [Prauserella alba]|uniref:NUDIX domain-containing protein n=1 Tax=Prauserella alba TaxID=176898 RepID=A0ABP4G2D9_9PSEU|nr:NUDIX hydrolase [Prauserella alba]MCP2181675.1 NUDIX domain-containing protein [Prauserella alba]